MTKKIFAIIVLIFLLVPFIGFAKGCYELWKYDPETHSSAKTGVIWYEGLIPCGKAGICQTAKVKIGGQETKVSMDDANSNCVGDLIGCVGDYGFVPCTFCHLFVIANDISEFIVIKLTPAVAVLMFMIGGIMYYFAGGDPGKVAMGKSIITKTVLGIIIIFGAWLITHGVLTAIGVEEWTGLQEGWFVTKCVVKVIPGNF